MDERRQFLKPGQVLSLGDTEYLIEDVEGRGGSSVVYRASYEDRLNQGFRHRVLIKELFPCHPGGQIYRDQQGEICCREDGLEWMERSRRSFYLGNEANLELLRQSPEKISGNINSYEAYGTFYSVMAVHGGNDLETVLEEGLIQKDLRWTARTILKILDVLDCFHQNGLLHLDISPDNILLLQEKAMLIDYNSVWNMAQPDMALRYLSEKAGYTAPEVRLRRLSDIGPATDLYSVCAVWFFMLTGKRLSEDEILGNGLSRCFPRDLEIFRGEPETACWKMVQIMKKGLHVLTRKRYQSVKELQKDTEELLLRIEGKGVSHSAAWENSRRSLRRLKQPEKEYLEREVCLEDGRRQGQRASMEELEKGKKLLITGPGGMGKTRLLLELWRQSVQVYRPSAPVVMYVPLAGYQEADEKNSYIRNYLARYLFLLEEHGEEILEQILDREDRGKLLLLLDGLNEAGAGRSGLLKEIETLGRKPAVGIMVTDRSDSVKAYGLHDFSVSRLLPLTEEVVDRQLEAGGIPCPAEPEVKSMLSNPMMLSLYERTYEMVRDSGRRLEETALDGTCDGLIRLYLDSLSEKEQRMAAGNPAKQLQSRYLIYHLLPDIAAEMKNRKKTILTLKEISALADRSYERLGKKEFAMAFPEYLGKSRLMLEGIRDGREWFDYGVTEQLWERLNLLEKSEEGNYSLIHDNFLGYLAGRGLENRKKAGRYRRREQGKRACVILAAAAVLGAGGIKAAERWLPDPVQKEITVKTTPELEEMIRQMEQNLGALGMQIDLQQQILKEAARREVLEGDDKALADFLDYSKKKQGMSAGYTAGRGDGKRWLEKLREKEDGFPLETLETLCGRTYEMDTISAEGLAHLERALSRKSVPYSDKEKLVDAYIQYLDAYSEVAYRELNLILSWMDRELIQEVQDTVEVMAVFSGYIRQYPYREESREDLERYLRTARQEMKDCVRDMRTLGYDLTAEE